MAEGHLFVWYKNSVLIADADAGGGGGGGGGGVLLFRG